MMPTNTSKPNAANQRATTKKKALGNIFDIPTVMPRPKIIATTKPMMKPSTIGTIIELVLLKCIVRNMVMMDVYECRDCEHPDNDVDPQTGQVIGPIHVAMSPIKALLLARKAGTLPRYLKVEEPLVQFCLICNRMCLKGYEYVVEQ